MSAILRPGSIVREAIDHPGVEGVVMIASIGIVGVQWYKGRSGSSFIEPSRLVEIRTPEADDFLWATLLGSHEEEKRTSLEGWRRLKAGEILQDGDMVYDKSKDRFGKYVGSFLPLVMCDSLCFRKETI